MRFFYALSKQNKTKQSLLVAAHKQRAPRSQPRPHHLHPGSWVAGTAASYSGPARRRYNCLFASQHKKEKPSCKTLPDCQEGVTLTERDPKDSRSKVESAVCLWRQESSARMWERGNFNLNLCEIQK